MDNLCVSRNISRHLDAGCHFGQCKWIFGFTCVFSICFWRQSFRPHKVWPGREGLSLTVTKWGGASAVSLTGSELRKSAYHLGLSFLLYKMGDNNPYLTGSLWGSDEVICGISRASEKCWPLLLSGVIRRVLRTAKEIKTCLEKCWVR